VDAVYFSGRGIDFVQRLEDHIDYTLLSINLGRSLSQAETSCSLAHKKALSTAHSLALTDPLLDWVLVVEDDADIDLAKFQTVSDELGDFNVDGAALVSYYVPQDLNKFGNRTHSATTFLFKRTRLWIPGAVAYAINRAAILALAPYIRLPVDSTPDWPVYFQRVQRFLAVRTQINESGKPTTLGNRTRMPISKRARLHFRQFTNLEQVAKTNGVTRRAVLNHLFVTPALRDARTLFLRLPAALRGDRRT